MKTKKTKEPSYQIIRLNEIKEREKVRRKDAKDRAKLRDKEMKKRMVEGRKSGKLPTHA